MAGRSTQLPPPRDVWNPERYGKFRSERSAPFLDLLALVERGDAPRIVDLGCGAGELTRLAHETLAARETVGLDSSAAMLEKAAAHAGGGLSFRQEDIGAFAEPGFDVILSNAALHWVPDHGALLTRLARLLARGGQLAIQVPANEAHPSHAIARDLPRDRVGRVRLVRGDLDRELPAPSEQAGEPREERPVIGHPVERRVRQDHVEPGLGERADVLLPEGQAAARMSGRLL